MTEYAYVNLTIIISTPNYRSLKIIFVFPATHGSGVGLVNMAAMVTKLELITGGGKILTLSAQNNKDIFNAAQVCY